MHTKRNTYILLAILCLVSIFLLQAFTPVLRCSQKEIKFTLDKEKAFKSPAVYIFTILFSAYLLVIFIGLMNIFYFLAAKSKNKTFITIVTEEEKRFPLSQEKTSQLFFLVIFFTFLVYLIKTIILFFNWKINLVGLSLILNLVFEIGIIIIVLIFISNKLLGFRLNVKQFYFLVKTYITALPIMLALLFFNNFFLEKIGMGAWRNPIIELFLTLKNNTLFTIISIQAVLFGPIAEELFFRGVIYKVLRKKYNFVVSSTFCSFIFALIHRSPQDILPIFLLSFILCYVYEKTQNISAPITLHIIHNSLNLSFLVAIRSLV